jgi:hypothetical protein
VGDITRPVSQSSFKYSKITSTYLAANVKCGYFCTTCGFHSSGYEEICPLGYNVVHSVKFNRRFGQHIASIFKAEEYAKQETSFKQAANRASYAAFSSADRTLRPRNINHS